MVEFEIEAGIQIPDSEIQSERSRIEDALSPLSVAVDVEDPSPQLGDLSTSLGSSGPPAPDGGDRPSPIPVDAPDEIAVGDAGVEEPEAERPDRAPLPVEDVGPLSVNAPDAVAVTDPSPLTVADPSPLAVENAGPLPVDAPGPVPVTDPSPLTVEEVPPVEATVDAPDAVATTDPSPLTVQDPSPLSVESVGPIPVESPEDAGVADPGEAPVADTPPVPVEELPPVNVNAPDSIPVESPEDAAVADPGEATAPDVGPIATEDPEVSVTETVPVESADTIPVSAPDLEVPDAEEVAEPPGRLTGRRRRRARRGFRLDRQRTTLAEEQLKVLEDIEDTLAEGGGGGGGGLLGGGGGIGLGLGALAGGGGLGTGLGLGSLSLGTGGAAGIGGLLGLGGVRLLQETGVMDSVREGGEEAGEAIPEEVIDAIELAPGLSAGTLFQDLAAGDFSFSNTGELTSRRVDTIENIIDALDQLGQTGGSDDGAGVGPTPNPPPRPPNDEDLRGADQALFEAAEEREDPNLAGQDGILNLFRDEFGLGAEREFREPGVRTPDQALFEAAEQLENPNLARQDGELMRRRDGGPVETETPLPVTVTDAAPDAFGAADRRVGQDAPPVEVPDDETRVELPDAFGAADRRVGPNRADTLPTPGPESVDPDSITDPTPTTPLVDVPAAPDAFGAGTRPAGPTTPGPTLPQPSAETERGDRGPGFRTPREQPGQTGQPQETNVDISAEASPDIENNVDVAFEDLRDELQSLNDRVRRDVVGEIDRVERDLRDEIEDLQRQIRRAN
jgi:hypothetical protein